MRQVRYLSVNPPLMSDNLSKGLAMTSTDNLRARIALMAAHCAGMVDIVALPVWVGTLIARFGFDPQQAGALATLFLASGVMASMILAPRFHRVRGRWIVPVAYAVAGAAFLACMRTSQFETLAVLHVVGGLATGLGLSVTHGTVALTSNPHRLFGFMQVAVGFFGIAYMVSAPQIIAAVGGRDSLPSSAGSCSPRAASRPWRFRAPGPSPPQQRRALRVRTRCRRRHGARWPASA